LQNLLNKFFEIFGTVTMKSGAAINGYYTPCHAEAFDSIAVIKDAKSGILLGLVSVDSVHGDKQA
jgi:hypothetical protein